MTTKVSYPCPRCDGRKHMSEFANVANGVCFKCGGAGVVYAKPTKKVVRPITEYQAQLLALVTEGDLSNMSFGKLSTLRDFAQWPLAQCPTLLAIWFERGEGYFQAAQADKLATLYGNA